MCEFGWVSSCNEEGGHGFCLLDLSVNDYFGKCFGNGSFWSGEDIVPVDAGESGRGHDDADDESWEM